MELSIVGCGVSGLTCGVALLEDPELAGSGATIYAHKIPPETTSDAAAAIWFPYGVFGDDRLLGWAGRTLQVLHELSRIEEAGVHGIEGTQLFRNEVPDGERGGGPHWGGLVEALWPAGDDEIPPGLGYVRGYSFRTRLVEMDRYLPYLMERFRAAGGVITRVEGGVGDLDELLAGADAVINCSGVYARGLVQDEHVYPSRGQVVRITPIPLTRFLMDLEDEVDLMYVVPRSHDCIVGGTAERDNWEEGSIERTTERILDRCARLVPEIRDAEVIETRVGLRPERRPIRLEEEWRDRTLVVHNYGHGGSGVTLSWGCAENVVSIVKDAAL